MKDNDNNCIQVEEQIILMTEVDVDVDIGNCDDEDSVEEIIEIKRDEE